jgi:hypothetical protein
MHEPQFLIARAPGEFVTWGLRMPEMTITFTFNTERSYLVCHVEDPSGEPCSWLKDLKCRSTAYPEWIIEQCNSDLVHAYLVGDEAHSRELIWVRLLSIYADELAAAEGNTPV